MRALLFVIVLSLPTVAAAQSRPTTNAPPVPLTIDEEAHLATSLYLAGSATLALGAVATIGLGIGSVEASLAHLFMPDPSNASAVLQDAAIAVGCAAGAIGLLLIGIAIRFDVESGARRSRAEPFHF